MTSVTLSYKHREGKAPHQYFMNDMRISKGRYDYLNEKAMRQDSFLTTRKGDVFTQSKTVYGV